MRKVLGIARDALYLLLGKYGAYLVTLVTLPFTARVLGLSQFGLLNLGMAAFFLGSILVDFGMSQYLAADFGRRALHSDLRRAYRRVRWSAFGVLVALLIAGLVTRDNVLICLALGALAGGASSMNELFILIGDGKFARVMWSQIIGRSAYLSSLLVILPHLPTGATALSCLLVSNVATNVAIWIWTKDADTPQVPTGGVYRRIFTQGGRTAGARMLSSLTGQGASSLYAFSVPAADIGLYGAADKLVRAGQSVFDAVGLSLLPRFTRLTTDTERFWGNAIRATILALIAATVSAAAFALAAPWVIPTIFGADFADAVPYAQALACILPAVAMSTTLVNSVLYVNGSASVLLLTSVVGALITLVGVVYSFWSGTAWTMVATSLLAEWGVAASIVCSTLSQRRHQLRRAL